MKRLWSSPSSTSATNYLYLGGVEVYEAVLQPMWLLLISHVPVYFLRALSESLGELLFQYFIFYYYGLDLAAAITTLKGAQFFIVESVPYAIHYAASEIYAHFLAGGQINAASAIFTYGAILGVVSAIFTLIVFLSVVHLLVRLLCAPGVVSYAEQYCYIVVAVSTLSHAFSGHFTPYFFVENREVVVLAMTLTEKVLKLASFLIMQLFYAHKPYPVRWIIFVADALGSVAALCIPTAFAVLPLLKISRTRSNAKFNLRYLSPFKVKLLREVCLGALSRIVYDYRWNFTVFFSCLVQIKTQGFSAHCLANLLLIGYYTKLRELASAFLTASEPVVFAIGFFNLLLKRFERVRTLTLQALLIFFAFSFVFGFLICALEPQMRSWFGAKETLNLAALEGILCSPMQIAYNVTICKYQRWRLVTLSAMHYIAASAFIITQAMRGKVNYSGLLVLCLANASTAIYQIPTIITFFRRQKAPAGPVIQQQYNMQREDSLSLSTKQDSNHNDNLSDIEPVAITEGLKTPQMKNNSDDLVMTFALAANDESPSKRQ